MKRPKVTVNCVASRYAGPGERIIEFSSANGGGLISLFCREDGTLAVDVYRTDHTVTVTHSGEKDDRHKRPPVIAKA